MSKFDNDTLKPLFLDEDEEEADMDLDDELEKKKKEVGGEEYDETTFEDEEDGGVDLEPAEEESEF